MLVEFGQWKEEQHSFYEHQMFDGMPTDKVLMPSDKSIAISEGRQEMKHWLLRKKLLMKMLRRKWDNMG